MNKQYDDIKEVSNFYQGARILIPAIASFVGSVIVVVWFVAKMDNKIDLIQQKLDAEVDNRVLLTADVKVNTDRLSNQAIVLGRFEEKLNNVEKTGTETLKLLRDYTSRR